MSLRKCCDICDKYMSQETDDLEKNTGALIEQMGEELADKLEKLIPGFDGTTDDLDLCNECIVDTVAELRRRKGRPLRPLEKGDPRGPMELVPLNRKIHFSQAAYAELVGALLPSERWYDEEQGGMVIFVTTDHWGVEKIVVSHK